MPKGTTFQVYNQACIEIYRIVKGINNLTIIPKLGVLAIILFIPPTGKQTSQHP